MFRFDEPAVEAQGRDRLDEYLPGARLMRPKRSKKALPPKLGLAVIMTDKLVGQENEDAIKLVMRQVTESLARESAKLYGSTNRVFVVGPLEFEYNEGEFEVAEGVMAPGTEVKVFAPVETENVD
ncbi:hypothetical protein LCGC14_1860960 [marine sediment metagenome]|uniref:Uncharacterized protein n=1 Tax=marine sediment metagenome TaxID=412755 RepID=A0A0F9J6L7_9ZZZZ